MVKIICEGQDDKKFLLKFLDSPSSDVFISMGGKNKLLDFNNIRYSELKKNKNINNILFIIDADFEKLDPIYGGYENTKKYIEILKDQFKGHFNDNELSIDYYISCNPNDNSGFLESLIISTIPNNKKYTKCVESFQECAKEKKKLKWVLQQICSIEFPPYNLEHKNFDSLKKKLENLF